MAAAALWSGDWVGNYLQGGQEYPQRLRLELADGVARGGGSDLVGTFTIEGEYRADEAGVRIGWIKTYDGAHSILYLGALQPDGSIQGEWRFQGGWGEAFRIAPAALGRGDEP